MKVTEIFVLETSVFVGLYNYNGILEPCSISAFVVNDVCITLHRAGKVPYNVLMFALHYIEQVRFLIMILDEDVKQLLTTKTCSS